MRRMNAGSAARPTSGITIAACASVRECFLALSWRRVERSAAGYEDVLAAVVAERFAGKSAMESFQPQTRDVEEP